MAVLVNGAACRFRRRTATRVQGLAARRDASKRCRWPANRGDVPVLFTAAADAPLAGRWSTSSAGIADPNQKIEGHLRQRTSLVRGSNNIEVWNRYTRPTHGDSP